MSLFMCTAVADSDADKARFLRSIAREGSLQQQGGETSHVGSRGVGINEHQPLPDSGILIGRLGGECLTQQLWKVRSGSQFG
jgi:hypothetical protein